MTFGERLRGLREERGISLAELARATSYSKSYLSRVETGRRPGNAALAAACARALGVDPDRLGPPDAPGTGVAAPGNTVAAGAAAPPPPAVPVQLPPAPGVFAGREAALAELDGALSSARPRWGEGGPRVWVIDGMGGIGKTALAVRWAHRARDRFPDGVLFSDLAGHGSAGAPREPGEVLDGFLRALGTDTGLIPPGVADRSALLRTLLAGRRVLLVLDNAAAPAQVRPLLPGAPGCVVLVTSRTRMAGLVVRDGARRVTLDPLPEEQAVELLRRTLGPERVDADPAAARELVRRCGRLPLALLVAAERALSRPGLTLTRVNEELRSDRTRLHVLAAAADGDSALRVVFSWSYRALAPEPARAFRLLALHPGAALTAESAAALLGTTAGNAGELLDVLADVHLLELEAPERFRFHSLLQVYGRELAEGQDPPRDRAAALDRLYDWYRQGADAAGRLLEPGARPAGAAPLPGVRPPVFAGVPDAVAWCEAHLADLLSVIRYAALAGRPPAAWQLPFALWSFFHRRHHRAEWLNAARIAVAAAADSPDPRALTVSLVLLGTAQVHAGRPVEAEIHLRRGLERCAADRGDPESECAARNHLAELMLRQGRAAEALELLEPALPLGRTIGHRWAERVTLTNLGDASLRLGRLADAERLLLEALSLRPTGTDHRTEGLALLHLGTVHRALGRLPRAVGCLRRALELHRAAGDRWAQGRTLEQLGHAFAALERPADALPLWQEALDLMTETGDPRAATLTAQLAGVRGGRELPPPGAPGLRRWRGSAPGRG
ncbi:NB-ARC domain-containing protein [Kitasatospora sp. SolWspMP-SS2h]|uniref:ATP-binding protein n=1 Tax=Kitasatospora sp. SolWspMP-SS2h TaxID=1305729 RepID=UPI000DC01BFB|nr:helix-turn-helix domain-containing protein [Kitasatospora sp. SolWspMP-SS2h]RAJ40122.1 NB-ARC domain-containing protein [Kitasatospora sp. SolWspMP-SS2h]